MNDSLKRLLAKSGYTIVRKRRRTSPTLAVIGGFGVGAGLAYMLDPDRGSRRRALARDRAIHALRVQQRMLEKGARDAGHRARSLGPRLAHLRSDEPSDEVLIARVRACLGHHVSHPGSIAVDAHDGEVFLSGPILRDELPGLVRAVRRVRGVQEVSENLEVHAEPGRVPGLQGEGRVPRSMLMRSNWPPALRLATAGGGLAATAYGLARGGTIGALISAAGTLAAIRGISNIPLSHITGLGSEPHAVLCQKTIHVRRSVEEVYSFWSDLRNLPRFMDHVIDVEPIAGTEDERSRWSLRGPAGTTWHWEAETTERVPNERIAWRTAGRTHVEHEGIVQFESVGPDETRIHVRMIYEPPAGAVGQVVAALLGTNPKKAMAEDLQRMKALLEHDHTQRSTESIPVPGGSEASFH